MTIHKKLRCLLNLEEPLRLNLYTYCVNNPIRYNAVRRKYYCIWCGDWFVYRFGGTIIEVTVGVLVTGGPEKKDKKTGWQDKSNKKKPK